MNQPSNPAAPDQTPAAAAGAPSNSPGVMTPANDNSAMSGQPRGPVSPDPATNPADGADLSLTERIAALEARVMELQRIAMSSSQAAVPVQRTVMRGGQRADETVQVPMRDFLIGLARRVGYVHRGE